MLWLFSAAVGYFATALAGIADKFLVSGRIEKPAAYTFLITTFSLVSLALAPFGLRVLSFESMMIFFVSGMLFAWSLLFLFSAFQDGDVSRVLPLVGIVSALVTLIPSIVRMFSSGAVPISGFSSFFLLLFGAWLVSFSDSNDTRFPKKNLGLSVLSGVFLASFFVLLKFGEGSGANFVSALVWSRFGVFLGGLSLLSVSSYRRDIISFFFKRRYSVSEATRVSTGIVPTWVIFLAGKTAGGIGALLIVFATYAGPVAIVQALIGVQFLCVFLIALVLSRRFPSIFGERMSLVDWVRKGAAFVSLSLGVWLSVRGGDALF